MIFKSELADAIGGLSIDLNSLAIKLSDLERRVEKVERHTAKAPASKGCADLEKAIKITKKKVGRPLGSKNKSSAVAKAKQPRTKDGKFAKKK